MCKIGEAIDEFEYEGKAALDEIFTEYDINAVRTDSDSACLLRGGGGVTVGQLLCCVYCLLLLLIGEYGE